MSLTPLDKVLQLARAQGRRMILVIDSRGERFLFIVENVEASGITITINEASHMAFSYLMETLGTPTVQLRQSRVAGEYILSFGGYGKWYDTHPVTSDGVEVWE